MKRWTDREPREYLTLGGVSASASPWIKQYFSSSFNLSESGIEFTSMNARVFGIFFKQYGIPPLFFCQLYLAYNMSRAVASKKAHAKTSV